MMFFFIHPTLSVTENSCRRGVRKGTGYWVGARGFPADPTPQTACSVIGRAPRVFVRITPNRVGLRAAARFAWSSAQRTLLVRLVWLQELSKVSALGCLHRTQFTQSFSACSQCPQRRWLSPSSQELLANSRFDGYNFAWRGAQHVRRTPVEDDSRLPVVVLSAAAILPAPTRCGASARSRTRREGTQRALPPFSSCVQAYAAFAAGHPKTTRFHVARGSTLVLSQEPRPKQGMAARHP